MIDLKQIQSREEFDKLLRTEKYLVIDFTSSWCGPCQALKPLLEWFEDDKEYAKLVIVSVNTDKFDKLADEYKVKSIPNLCFMQDGKVVKRFVGVPKIEELRKYIRSYLGLHSLKWLFGLG